MGREFTQPRDHLIGHPCSPNCTSKHFYLWRSGQGLQAVIFLSVIPKTVRQYNTHFWSFNSICNLKWFIKWFFKQIFLTYWIGPWLSTFLTHWIGPLVIHSWTRMLPIMPLSAITAAGSTSPKPWFVYSTPPCTERELLSCLLSDSWRRSVTRRRQVDFDWRGCGFMGGW